MAHSLVIMKFVVIKESGWSRAAAEPEWYPFPVVIRAVRREAPPELGVSRHPARSAGISARDHGYDEYIP